MMGETQKPAGIFLQTIFIFLFLQAIEYIRLWLAPCHLQRHLFFLLKLNIIGGKFKSNESPQSFIFQNPPPDSKPPLNFLETYKT
ncbi:hypothetical protein [Caldithrix abyssi]|uniref:hypothetical protein n=1 Tax=Caldithrix abyssi TaxID=187145 RepID=UPI0005C790FB|nr:hypothetical protein [Caldithrix abyssi]